MIRKIWHCIKSQSHAKPNLQQKEPKQFDVSTHPLPEADKWVLSEFVIQRIIPVVGFHPYPLDELLLMCSTVNYFRPDVIIEWGTHYGASARVFFEMTQALSLKTEVHTVDLPLEVEHVENIKDQNTRGALVKGTAVHLHLGDGMSIAREILTEKKPVQPLFFLDGDHAYETVRSELASLKEIAPRAVVLAHDTFYQKVSSKYNIGPYQAITEFTSKYSLPLYSTVLGLPGMSLTYW